MNEQPTPPKREFTEDEAREFWDKARAKATRGDCGFSGLFFPEDPSGQGFQRVTFGGDADFSFAEFGGYADFSFAEFGGYVYFSRANFGGDAEFSGVEFSSYANFRGAEFGGNADFFGAQFGGNANFRDATFGGDASFSRAKFCGVARFVGAVSDGVFVLDPPGRNRKGQRIPFAKRIEGDGAYRLAKQSAADRGAYRMAGQFHYIEQSTICLRRLARGRARLRGQTFDVFDDPELDTFGTRLRGVGELISAAGEFVFAKLLFGYGQRIRGVLIAAGVVIAGFTLLYCINGVVVVPTTATAPARMAYDLGSSLYFSIVTFTTLGYGDLRPSEGLRLLAATEALMGACLMALFVVTMARKFTR